MYFLNYSTMEAEKKQREQQKATDPQQNEIDGNILGGIFEDIVGDTKGRQDVVDKPSASQTGGEEQVD
jgi:hypothetical protein